MLFQRVAQHQAVAAAAKAGKKSLRGGGGAAFAASPPSVATGPCGEAVAFNQRPRSAKAASGHAAKSLVRESRRVFSSLGGSVAALGSSGGGFGSAFEAAKNSVYSLLGLNSFPPYDGARERVVVLGTGWAALNFFRGLNPNKCVCVSEVAFCVSVALEKHLPELGPWLRDAFCLSGSKSL